MSSHPNCYYGADGGPGVSCAVEVTASYDHTFNLVVTNIGQTSWRGILVDMDTGVRTVIGEWTLPTGAGKLQANQGGFVEYYPWNIQPFPYCPALPRTEAFFGDPTSQTPGAAGGKVSRIVEYGDCANAAAAWATKVPGGYNIGCGF